MIFEAYYDKELGRVIYNDPAKADNFKNRLRHNEPLMIAIYRGQERRTKRSNRYFHALVHEWCKYQGKKLPEEKMLFKIYYGVWVDIDDMDDVPTWDGKPVMYENSRLFVKSTREYNQSEFNELIKCVERDCLESGMDITDTKVIYG